MHVNDKVAIWKSTTKGFWGIPFSIFANVALPLCWDSPETFRCPFSNLNHAYHYRGFWPQASVTFRLPSLGINTPACSLSIYSGLLSEFSSISPLRGIWLPNLNPAFYLYIRNNPGKSRALGCRSNCRPTVITAVGPNYMLSAYCTTLKMCKAWYFKPERS